MGGSGLKKFLKMKNFLRYFYGVQFIVLFIIIKGIFKKKKKKILNRYEWKEMKFFFSYSNDCSIYDPFSLRDRYIKSENDAT